MDDVHQCADGYGRRNRRRGPAPFPPARGPTEDRLVGYGDCVGWTLRLSLRLLSRGDTWLEFFHDAGIHSGRCDLVDRLRVHQSRSKHPLLPLRIVLDRNRGGAFLHVFVGAAIFAVFLFLVYYLQQILGFSPIKCGLATMPMAFGLIAAAAITTTLLLPRIGPRPLVAPGMLIAAAGMALLTQLGVHSTYVGGVLPGLVIAGFGLGTVLAPTLNIATAGIESGDSGVASALANTMQQVGGSLGIALLATLGARAATSSSWERPPLQQIWPKLRCTATPPRGRGQPASSPPER